MLVTPAEGGFSERSVVKNRAGLAAPCPNPSLPDVRAT
jgi:hypothetical protein